MSDVLNKKEYINKNKYITYSVYFGDKDQDLWEWVEAIPNGRFSLIIKDTIRAYITNDVNYLLPIYKKELKNCGPVQKNFALCKSDYDIYIYFSNYRKNLISNEIKRIIRYFLNRGSTQAKIGQISEHQEVDTGSSPQTSLASNKLNYLNGKTLNSEEESISNNNELAKKLVQMKNRNVRQKKGP